MQTEKVTPKNISHNVNGIEIDYDFGCEKKNHFGTLTSAVMSRANEIVPSIKGDLNTIIDLETGDITENKKSGTDQLFERFLKHANKNHVKESSDFR